MFVVNQKDLSKTMLYGLKNSSWLYTKGSLMNDQMYQRYFWLLKICNCTSDFTCLHTWLSFVVNIPLVFLLANVVQITTIGPLVKDTTLPILAKYSIIRTLKCSKISMEQDTNSNNYLKLTIFIKLKYYSMSRKITKQKKKQMDTPI